MVKFFRTGRHGRHGDQRDLHALLAIGDRYERDAMPTDTDASLRQLHRRTDPESPGTTARAGAIQRASQTWVPQGTIGLVVAKAGRVSPAGTRLAPFVECDFFQDGEAFLRNGGHRGKPLAAGSNSFRSRAWSSCSARARSRPSDFSPSLPRRACRTPSSAVGTTTWPRRSWMPCRSLRPATCCLP